MQVADCYDLLFVQKLPINLPYMQAKQGTCKKDWQETKVRLERSIFQFSVNMQCYSL